MCWVLLAIAINWGAPLVMWLYPAAMVWIFKDFTFEGFQAIFPKFRLATTNVEPWHARMWRDWGGFGSYGFICYRDAGDQAWLARTMIHEEVHCWTWILMGLLFNVAYLGHVLFIYLFQKNKHPYLDCWAERLARAKAGQQVDFTPAEWPQGAGDRWPWW